MSNHPLCTGRESTRGLSRRHFLNRFGMGLGGIALAELLRPRQPLQASSTPGVLAAPHHTAKAKRVIYLFQSGGPSQLETFDYKPLLNEKQGQQLPDSVRMG